LKFKEVFDKFEKGFGNTLYYPGCYSDFYLKQIVDNYKKILKFLNVDFVFHDNLACCGLVSYEAGYKEETSNLIELNSKFFSENNITRIITNCPGCAYFFSKNYSIEVLHISKIIFDNLNKFVDLDKNVLFERVIYVDSSYLGRFLNIYEEPREIIKYFGYDLLELLKNRKYSVECGISGGLKENYPEISNKIAKKLLFEAKKLGAKKLITACPKTYNHFMENNETNLDVLELSQIVIKKIKRKTDIIEKLGIDIIKND